MESTNINSTQVNTLRNYYKLHARIYQATRWIFLFGRRRIVHALKLPMLSEKTLLEVGCGTGHNLSTLVRYYPNLHLVGLDISPDMLAVAARKLQRFSRRVLFLEKPYGAETGNLPAKPDIILFSYCLTMMNPGWEDALQRAHEDLAEGGQIAVLDFHGSENGFFRRWMGVNHVRMDKHLLPQLEARFDTTHREVRKAYGGLWTFVMFVGQKKSNLLPQTDKSNSIV